MIGLHPDEKTWFTVRTVTKSKYRIPGWLKQDRSGAHHGCLNLNLWNVSFVTENHIAKHPKKKIFPVATVNLNIYSTVS